MNRAKESMTRSVGRRDPARPRWTSIRVLLTRVCHAPTWGFAVGTIASKPRLYSLEPSILPSLVRHSYSPRMAGSRRPLRRPTSRSHGRCVLAKASWPVNSKSGGSLSLPLRFFARVFALFSPLATVLENHPDAERKPDQMTLGVSFHYGDGRESTAESVAIPLVYKRKSVLLPLFFYSSPSSSFPSVDLYGVTEQFSFCFKHFHYLYLSSL